MPGRMLCVLMLLMANAAFAVDFKSDDFEIRNYKMRQLLHNNQFELFVSGIVKAKVSCEAAVLRFKVFDKDGKALGLYESVHGAFSEGQGWELDRGTLMDTALPEAKVVQTANRVEAQEVVCLN